VSRPKGHSAAGRIRSIEKSNDLIGNRTRDILACSTVPKKNVFSIVNKLIVNIKVYTVPTIFTLFHDAVSIPDVTQLLIRKNNDHGEKVRICMEVIVTYF
jgi:hypothetical protein